jgi:hypothetical protein
MPEFVIDAYTLMLGNNGTGRFAQLFMTSPTLSHGIVNRGSLRFRENATGLTGNVYNVGGLNFNGISVYADLPFEEFDRIYDAVRSEAPVSLRYYHASGSTTTRARRAAYVATGEEIPGEGPEDEDAS